VGQRQSAPATAAAVRAGAAQTLTVAAGNPIPQRLNQQGCKPALTLHTPRAVLRFCRRTGEGSEQRHIFPHEHIWFSRHYPAATKSSGFRFFYPKDVKKSGFSADSPFVPAFYSVIMATVFV
jgi:hypothetical protein